LNISDNKEEYTKRECFEAAEDVGYFRHWRFDGSCRTNKYFLEASRIDGIPYTTPWTTYTVDIKECSPNKLVANTEIVDATCLSRDVVKAIKKILSI
jgi:hypothetical protein